MHTGNLHVGRIPAKKCIGAVLRGRTEGFRDIPNRYHSIAKPIGDRTQTDALGARQNRIVRYITKAIIS